MVQVDGSVFFKISAFEKNQVQIQVQVQSVQVQLKVDVWIVFWLTSFFGW